MKRRSLRNGVIVVITLGALTGVGTMVASASTRTNDSAAQGGNSAGQRGNDADRQADQNGAADQNGVDQNGAQRPFDPDASPSPSLFDPDVDPDFDQDQADADTNACVAVQLRNAQGNDDARLCTTVQRTGQRVDRIRVSLTAAGECQGNVTLQATTGQGQALTDTVPCADPATATFSPGREVADGSQVCGVLAADDRFAAARACVRIAA